MTTFLSLAASLIVPPARQPVAAIGEEIVMGRPFAVVVRFVARPVGHDSGSGAPCRHFDPDIKGHLKIVAGLDGLCLVIRALIERRQSHLRSAPVLLHPVPVRTGFTGLVGFFKRLARPQSRPITPRPLEIEEVIRTAWRPRRPAHCKGRRAARQEHQRHG